MQTNGVAEELNRLHEQRMSKAITQAEYEKRKKALLKYAPIAEAPTVLVSKSQDVEYVQVALPRSRKRGLGLLLFIAGMSWFFAWVMTDGGAKTDVAGKFHMPMAAWGIILFVAGLVYMLPAFVAGLRRHPHYLAIVVVNLLLATTGIVWICCLVWALTGSSQSAQTIIVRSQ